MKKPDTKAIRAYADKADPGPWGVWENHAEVWSGIKRNSPGEIAGDGPIAEFHSREEDIDPAWEDGEPSREAVNNAVFCANARDDVPRLCDRVEVLEAALRHAKDHINHAYHCGNLGGTPRCDCGADEAAAVAHAALEGK